MSCSTPELQRLKLVVCSCVKDGIGRSGRRVSHDVTTGDIRRPATGTRGEGNKQRVCRQGFLRGDFRGSVVALGKVAVLDGGRDGGQ